MTDMSKQLMGWGSGGYPPGDCSLRSLATRG